ncbi:TolB family protein [Pseudarcicella hirudinis]|uniref:TolB family protein n=1 Tax=Pseudarcicella hirudinis TaxID=1079859 RepID=UPI0035E84020
MKKICTSLCLLLLSLQVFAQFSLEQILNSPFPTELKASPSGNKIVWVFNQQGSRNVFIAEGPDFKARQLTAYEGDNGQEINSLAFTPDGNSVIFLRGGASNSSGEIPNPTQTQEGIDRAIYVIGTDGKNLKKLAQGFYPKISPKGDVLVYLSAGQVWTVPMDGSKAGVKLFQSRGTQK